jgi:hypothetical protein
VWSVHGELRETEVVGKWNELIMLWMLSLETEAADERIAQFVARRLVGSLLNKIVSPAGAAQLDRDVRRLANGLHARGGPSARDEYAAALLAAQMLACASAREAEDVLAAAAEWAHRDPSCKSRQPGLRGKRLQCLSRVVRSSFSR